MPVDLAMVIAGLLVGLLVGMTGVGGGALLTPLLILVFHVPSLAAVSSDLLTALVMKPVGALVHGRRGTVHWRLAGWLSLGSVPAAFAGVFLLRALGSGPALQHGLKIVIGGTLLLAVGAMLTNDLLAARRARRPTGRMRVRPAVTVAVGALAGLLVGMSSVGSGSLVLALLLLLHPDLRADQLVGTDLLQAMPLVAAATLGHLVYGDVRLHVAGALILGAVPGTYLGARFAVRRAGRAVTPVIAAVLVGSGCALFGAPVTVLLAGAAVAGTVLAVTRIGGSDARAGLVLIHGDPRE